MQFKKTFKPALLATMLVSCFATAAQAQEAQAEPANEQTLGPVVVTAARVEQLQKDAIPGTILISQEILQQKKLADLPSILRSEVGIEFARNGGAGTGTSLFMRGTESRHVLLLIDGIPVQDPSTIGTVDTLSHLMPDQIDHIEVVKGNVSSIYGSGAMGGVIQVFTKKGTNTPQANAFIEYGRYDTVKFGGNLTGKTDFGTSYAFSVTRAKTNGFSAKDVGKDSSINGDNDGNRNIGFTAALSHEINSDHEIGARIYYHHDKYEYDNNYNYNAWSMPDPEERSRGRSIQMTAAVYSKDRFNSNWVSTVTASRTDIKRDSWENYSDYQGVTGFESEANMFQWSNQVALNSDWTVTAGAEYGHEKVSTNHRSNGEWDWSTFTFGPSKSGDGYTRDKQSIYAGLLGNIGVHHIQANIRYDHVEDSGSDFTGYLGYAYDITDAWKILANVSSSFQAPSMYQMYDATYGNKGLESEKSKAAELGIQYASGDTTFRTTAFEWRTRDLIDFAYTADHPNGTYFNTGKAKNYGIEMTGSTKLWGFDLKGNATWQNPKNRDTDKQLLRRAKQMASIEVGKTWGKFYGDVNVQYTGHRKDSDNIDLGSYTTVNLDARYEINKHLSVYGRVENLFNKDYETAYGYNQTGAAAYVGVNVKM
ncbi:MAG: TonB-dependent receptor domain-containing protein [Oxalobacter sp.]